MSRPLGLKRMRTKYKEGVKSVMVTTTPPGVEVTILLAALGSLAHNGHYEQTPLNSSRVPCRGANDGRSQVIMLLSGNS